MEVWWKKCRTCSGSAGAGKTTISRLFTRRHGLRWYSVDAHIWQHRDRALTMGIALPRCGPGDYDRGPMILEDLRDLPSNPLVVVEGALVTPEMARPSSQADSVCESGGGDPLSHRVRTIESATRSEHDRPHIRLRMRSTDL